MIELNKYKEISGIIDNASCNSYKEGNKFICEGIYNIYINNQIYQAKISNFESDKVLVYRDLVHVFYNTENPSENTTSFNKNTIYGNIGIGILLLVVAAIVYFKFK